MSAKRSRVQFDEATHTYTVNGTEYPSVTQIIRFLSYDQSKCADQQMALIARERGTEVHEAAALYDYSGDIAEDLSADAAPYLSAYIQFCRDYKPKWNYIEHVLGANRDGIPYGYCGTLDRAGFIDGKFCILDIKTSYKVNIPSLSAQLAAYNNLLKFHHTELYKEDTDLYGLQLMRTGKYRLYKVDYQQGIKLLKSCLDIHKQLETMKGVRYAVK